MFDLFRSRDKAVRIVLGVMLGFVGLSMLLYLIPSFSGMGGTGGADSQVIAQVGDDPITLRQVQIQIQGLVKNRQIPAQLLGIYVPQIVDQMVTERALAYEAKRLGFAISDTDLANTLQNLGGGRFNDTAAYKQFVEEQGFSVPEFENNLRDSILTVRLESVVGKSIVVSPDEVKDEFSKRNDKIKLSYLVFDESNLKSKINPTEDELKTYFGQHKNAYRMPEQRNASVLVVDQAKVESGIQISPDQLHASYSANLDSFRTPERIHARHILLTTTGKSKDEIPAIRKKIEGILTQLKSGADFAEVAKTNSQDPGSASKGGDLGWVVRGQMVKPFEAAAFSVKPGQLSDIITTDYGFHIIQVLEHQDARVKPFDEVKAELVTAQKKQALAQTMQRLADQAVAELRKAPQQGAQIAAKLGLTLVTAQKLGPSDPVPGLVSPQLSQAIAGLHKNAVGEPVAIGTEKMAIPVCTDVIPSRPAEFSEVVNQIRTSYSAAAIMKLEAEYGVKAAADLKAGKDIQAIAKSLGVEVKTPDAFAIVGAVEGFGPANALTGAFSKNLGDVVGPYTVSNKTLVGKIVEKTSGDPALLAAQREGITQEIKSRKVQEAQSLFEDSIRTKLTQQGKIKINKEALSRLSAGYNQG
jgi:peptidyl-prolyl cis-trans isomerase D